MSALDAKVPDYVWNEVIARDICTYWVGAAPGTFAIELLRETEFLLFKGPRSGPGMTWENTISHIRIVHDSHDLGSMEVTAVAGPCTMKQAKIDLTNTCEYRQAHIMGGLAAVKGRAWNLAIKNAKLPAPQPRGQGYMRRADQYFGSWGPSPGTYSTFAKAC